MSFLAGRTGVVTGGTKGIGRAIAAALAREGASVAICGRDESQTSAAAAALASETGGTVEGRACDVRSRDQVRGFFEFVDRTFYGLDILVNNAGLGRFSPVANLTAEEWHLTLETNLTGVFHCCQEAIPRLKARGGGYLIQISSLAGKNPFAGGAAYNASKFALNGFAEAMMLDHRHDGIRVTNICPGSVNTDFSPQAVPGGGWKIQPEDIADIVLGLLRIPERTMVSYLEVRPSRPPRK